MYLKKLGNNTNSNLSEFTKSKASIFMKFLQGTEAYQSSTNTLKYWVGR